MYKVLDEIHKIREQIYVEEKGLSNKEVIESLHKRVEKIIKERDLKVKHIEEQTVRV